MIIIISSDHNDYDDGDGDDDETDKTTRSLYIHWLVYCKEEVWEEEKVGEEMVNK